MQPKFYGLFKQLFKLNSSPKQQIVTSGLKECKKSQRGFNAIELSLVLAVISVAIVATIRVMGNNSEKQQSNQMVSDVTAFVSNIRHAYSSSEDGYKDLDNTTVIAMKAYPGDLRVNGSEIDTQFSGGTVVIIDSPNKIGSIPSFDITYSHVPSSVCASVIGSLSATMFLQIKVGTDIVYGPDTTLSGSNVAAKCAGAGADKKATGVADITFTVS